MGFWSNVGEFFKNAAGALVGGAFGIGSSVMDSRQQNENIEKQINAQREENEKSRDWAAAQASQENIWNIEQWKRENEYNSPSAQRDRLIAAGYNPDLAYGGNITGLAGSSPAMVSAKDNAYPTDYSSLLGRQSVAGNTFGSMAQSAREAALTNAQIEVMKSQANKNNADAGVSSANEAATRWQTSYNMSVEDIRKSLEQGQLHTQFLEWQNLNSQIDLNWKQGRFILKQMQMADKQMAALSAQIDWYKSTIKNLDEQTLGQKLDNFFKTPMSWAVIDRIRSEAQLSRTQAQDITRTYLSRVALMDAQSFSADSSANLNVFELNFNRKAMPFRLNMLQAQDKQLKLNFELDTKFKGKFMRSQIIGNYVNMSANAINALSYGFSTFSQFLLKGQKGAGSPPMIPPVNSVNGIPFN